MPESALEEVRGWVRWVAIGQAWGWDVQQVLGIVRPVRMLVGACAGVWLCWCVFVGWPKCGLVVACQLSELVDEGHWYQLLV